MKKKKRRRRLMGQKGPFTEGVNKQRCKQTNKQKTK